MNDIQETNQRNSFLEVSLIAELIQSIEQIEEACKGKEGEDIVEKYGVRAVPTLLLVDDSGTLISKHVGILSVEGIKSFANETN